MGEVFVTASGDALPSLTLPLEFRLNELGADGGVLPLEVLPLVEEAESPLGTTAEFASDARPLVGDALGDSPLDMAVWNEDAGVEALEEGTLKPLLTPAPMVVEILNDAREAMADDIEEKLGLGMTVEVRKMSKSIAPPRTAKRREGSFKRINFKIVATKRYK